MQRRRNERPVYEEYSDVRPTLRTTPHVLQSALNHPRNTLQSEHNVPSRFAKTTTQFNQFAYETHDDIDHMSDSSRNDSATPEQIRAHLRLLHNRIRVKSTKRSGPADPFSEEYEIPSLALSFRRTFARRQQKPEPSYTRDEKHEMSKRVDSQSSNSTTWSNQMGNSRPSRDHHAWSRHAPHVFEECSVPPLPQSTYPPDHRGSKPLPTNVKQERKQLTTASSDSSVREPIDESSPFRSRPKVQNDDFQKKKDASPKRPLNERPLEEVNPFTSVPKVRNDVDIPKAACPKRVSAPRPENLPRESPFKSVPKVRNDVDILPKSVSPKRSFVSAAPHSSPFDELPVGPKSSRSNRSMNELPSESPVTVAMEQCAYCERKFSVDVISKHESVCSKVKSRPKFDVQKHRLAGLEVTSKSLKKGAGVAARALDDVPIKVKKASWKDKSDQLRAAIGAARASDPAERQKYESELARVNQATLTRCEFCGRSFNAEAAQRHIPICKNKSLVIPRDLPQGKQIPLGGTGAVVKLPAISGGVRLPRIAPQQVNARAVSGPVVGGGGYAKPVAVAGRINNMASPQRHSGVNLAASAGPSAISRMRF